MRTVPLTVPGADIGLLCPAPRAACSLTHVYAPAELTWRRAALVNNSNLARAAADAQLQQVLVARSKALMSAVKSFAARQQQASAGGVVKGDAPGSSASSAHGAGNLAGVFAAAAAAAAVATAAGVRVGGGRVKWGEEDQDLWRKVWEGKSAEEGDNEEAAVAAAGSTTAGLHAPKALADIVESLVGAYLIDSSSSGQRRGYDWRAGWRLVQQLLPYLR